MNSTLFNSTQISCPEDTSDFIVAEFWLISVFGGAVCVFGIGLNMALLQVLFQRKLRTTYLIYLAALTIIDLLVIISFAFLMVIIKLSEYLSSYILSVIWHSYVRYFYTLSRIVTMASTYLVLVCTLERYWEVIQIQSSSKVHMTQRKRYVVVASVILISVVFRAVVFLEVSVNWKEDCDGTMAYASLNQTDLITNQFYSTVYSFWLVHVATVFFPFPALVFLNAAITLTWRKVLVAKCRRASMDIRKFVKRSQSARKMMVAIVTSYLVCNTLHFVLTCWEHIDMHFLRRHPDFYAFASDSVTLSTAINASLRLPIYYASNSAIRLAIKNLWFAKKVKLVYNRSRNSFRRQIWGIQGKRRMSNTREKSVNKTNTDEGRYVVLKNSEYENGMYKPERNTRIDGQYVVLRAVNGTATIPILGEEMGSEFGVVL